LGAIWKKGEEKGEEKGEGSGLTNGHSADILKR
jgi:hypothetical protein